MPAFNEPEKYLLEKWADVRLLENAVDEVRRKYTDVLDKVLDDITKSHPEFDCRFLKLKHNSVAIGKDKWPKAYGSWPTGFYIEEIGLDNLLLLESERPFKCVWFFDPNPKDAKKKVRLAAERILSVEEFRQLEFESDSKGGGFTYYLEQSRQALLESLVKDQSRPFIECMVDHFEWMLQFAAAFDEILMPVPQS